MLLFVLQELINRHLITMAQIDHSENPGKVTSWHKELMVTMNVCLCVKKTMLCMELKVSAALFLE